MCRALRAGPRAGGGDAATGLAQEVARQAAAVRRRGGHRVLRVDDLGIDDLGERCVPDRRALVAQHVDDHAVVDARIRRVARDRELDVRRARGPDEAAGFGEDAVEADHLVVDEHPIAERVALEALGVVLVVVAGAPEGERRVVRDLA